MLLGAHVSTAGGCRNAPGRAAAIAANAIQVFTKQPNRWAEVEIGADECAAWSEAVREHGVDFANAHDSYLINLATADPILRDRSYSAFVGELRRAEGLGLDALVTHPGNATDGDRGRALVQNAELVERALEAVPGCCMVLLETTAGAGSVLGATFEELAEIIARIGPAARERVGICVDTCHVWAAGYDLVGDYEGVMARLEDTVGLSRLRLFHLNDSLGGLASRKDRHAGIGEGTLGDEPFRRIMTDPRFAATPKVLETPKGDDQVTADRANLAKLRAFML
jgi:deoxyribonuclease IV